MLPSEAAARDGFQILRADFRPCSPSALEFRALSLLRLRRLTLIFS